MYKIEEIGYICIPCINLATKINPGEKDDDDESETGQFKYITHNYEL